jgi:ankyrin repeat protein
MALIVAARQGHLTAAEVAISAGANLDCELHPDRRTPLSWAAGNGKLPMVQLLLARGAQVYQGTSYKDARLPLSWAASNGHQEVVKVLLKAGVDPTVQETTSGRTALSWAVGTGQEEVVKLL